MLFKPLRLTFLAIIPIYCILLVSCAKLPQNQQLNTEKHAQISENAININTATAAELETLPRIGKGTAKKIIEFREKNGAFRRPEHLILVRGMSDKKFREIQSLVKVE